MKWITREHVKVDRVACPWLIKKFVDKDPEFVFVPADKVMTEAKRLDAIPYDVKDVELGHHGKECSFEAILKKYKLTGDPALVLLGRIVDGADTDNTLYNQPEGAGLEAIAEGFKHLGYKDDHAQNAAEWIVYDALYAYCQEMVKRGKPRGDFMNRLPGDESLSFQICGKAIPGRSALSGSDSHIIVEGRAMAETVDFDNAATGAAPDGWTLTMTGRGQPKWTIEAEPTAPSKPNVLKQSGHATFHIR